MVRRAAFDVGSGAVKMTVADVDMHAGTLPSVAKYLHTARDNLLLAEDLESSGTGAFSEAVLQDLWAILDRFVSGESLVVRVWMPCGAQSLGNPKP